MNPADYAFLRKLLKERSGLDLSAEKQYLAEGRLQPLARRLGLGGIGDLVVKIRIGNEAVTTQVVEAMTTNETFFFRDRTPFDHLCEEVIPSLLRARAARRSLRIWCAASSTGQEPYSVAMALKEMSGLLAGWRIEIVATDLSQQVLDRSASGAFTQFEVQRGLPIQILMKYFKQEGEVWQIDAAIRGMVRHRRFNLLHDFAPLGVFDVIFCRNVLIYFDQDTKKAILGRLAKALESDGYLTLGAAETVVALTDAFRPHPNRRGLYRPTPAAESPSIAPVRRPSLRVAASNPG